MLRALVADGAQGEVALVDTATRVWANAPQRATQAVDRLMALRLVSGAAIVAWVFGSPGVRALSDELSTGLAWEAFYNAVNKMLARTQVRYTTGVFCFSLFHHLHTACFLTASPQLLDAAPFGMLAPPLKSHQQLDWRPGHLRYGA